MRKFEIQSTKTSQNLTVGYDTKGCLVYVHLVADNSASWEYVAKEMYDIESMQKITSRNKMKVTEIYEEISFEKFWDEYNYKLDKKRGLEKWKKLSIEEQSKAFHYIKTYRNELNISGAKQMYVKTYLHNKVWIN